MARLPNARLIDASDLGSLAERTYGPLRKNPFTKRIETQASRLMRAALKDHLTQAMVAARADAPYRTGASYKTALVGARAFGTNFSQLRGHIVADAKLVVHDRGTDIYPGEAEYLAIPIYHGRKPDGAPKLARPYMWKRFGSFVFKSKKTGKLYIVRQGPDKKLQFLYALVESVEIKGTRWATNAWAQQLPYLLQEWGNIVTSFMTTDIVGEAYSKGSKRR